MFCRSPSSLDSRNSYIMAKEIGPFLGSINWVFRIKKWREIDDPERWRNTHREVGKDAGGCFWRQENHVVVFDIHAARFGIPPRYSTWNFTPPVDRRHRRRSWPNVNFKYRQNCMNCIIKRPNAARPSAARGHTDPPMIDDHCSYPRVVGVRTTSCALVCSCA